MNYPISYLKMKRNNLVLVFWII